MSHATALPLQHRAIGHRRAAAYSVLRGRGKWRFIPNSPVEHHQSYYQRTRAVTVTVAVTRRSGPRPGTWVQVHPFEGGLGPDLNTRSAILKADLDLT